jgi:hypothetical protein
VTSRSLSGVSSRSQQKKEFPHDSLRRLATRASRALLSAAFAVMALITLAHQQAAAQGATIEVWVDPVNGVDPSAGSTTAQQFLWINDPNYMFKSMQRAIDVAHHYLRSNYDPANNPNEHAIVWALPGLYGPWGTNSSGDPLSIYMRDRVHVQGMGARRCVIRGIKLDPPYVTHVNHFWPSLPNVGSTQSIQVLVTFELSHPRDFGPSGSPYANLPAPWLVGGCDGDTAEVFDGFCLQGGDVQVLVSDSPIYAEPVERVGRISNCIFDMRDEFTVPDPDNPGNAGDPGQNLAPALIEGPSLGIMLHKRYGGPTAASNGYRDQPFLITHNTFVMAQWGYTNFNLSDTGWVRWAKKGAVAIIDVTDPMCGPGGDPNNVLRGVGHAGIMGNLFRTMDDEANIGKYHRPMLGIDRADTLFETTPGVFIPTNAFNPILVDQLVGNNYYYSVPVVSPAQVGSDGCSPVWNSHTTPSSGTNYCTFSTFPPYFANGWPLEAVPIWRGRQSAQVGFDPCFVGEYISLSSTSPGQMDHFMYADWRILPGSPMEDAAYPIASISEVPRFLTSQAAVSFDTAALTELSLFRTWDGEHWGNPRWVGAATDIGFDERHLMISTASWANDSNSHGANTQPAFLSPHIQNISNERRMIFPRFAGGVQLDAANMSVLVHHKMESPNAGPPPAVHGWINPPLSLASPGVNGSLPLGYQVKYILYDNTGDPGMPGPWSYTLTTGPTGTQVTYDPVSGWSATAQVIFHDVSQLDDECTVPGGGCYHSYFNQQPVVLESTTVKLRGNLQAEFR